MDRQLVCKGYYHRQFRHGGSTRTSLKYYRLVDTSTYEDAFLSGEHKKHVLIVCSRGKVDILKCLSQSVCLICLSALLSLVLPARIVRSRQWCEMAPCLEGEVCSLLFNRSGWTCTRGSGRIKTVTVIYKT